MSQNHDVFKELKDEIKDQTDALICETHPAVCELRDANYKQLETTIINFILQGDEGVSIQTAIAESERSLSE